MAQRYSEAARAVVQFANQEATRAGHSYIGTEDILIAIAIGQNSIVAEVLQAHGVDAFKIRSKIAEMPPDAFDNDAPVAKRIIENAMEEVRQLNHTEIDSDHLMLGLLKDPNSRACKVLVGFGVDLDRVRADILGRLIPGSASAIASRKSLEARFQDHPRVLALRQSIELSQSGLEQAVSDMDFKLAASYRDQRLGFERALEELYSELVQS